MNELICHRQKEEEADYTLLVKVLKNTIEDEFMDEVLSRFTYEVYYDLYFEPNIFKSNWKDAITKSTEGFPVYIPFLLLHEMICFHSIFIENVEHRHERISYLKQRCFSQRLYVLS